MGDLVHMMYVVANTPGRHDLYITDRRDLHSDGFLYSLEETIAELYPVLRYQEYVKSIQPYTGPVTESTDGEFINLNMWRRYAYSASWTNLLSNLFNVPINGGKWMDAPNGYKYSKIVHCSTPPARKGSWDGINLHGGIFMGTVQEYQAFNRPELPHIVPHSLKQIFSIIRSAHEFIGNQSLPLAIACALDIPRIGVLNQVDQAAYAGEEKIFKNFLYVL